MAKSVWVIGWNVGRFDRGGLEDKPQEARQRPWFYLDLPRSEGRARELAEHLRKEKIGF